MGRRPVRMLLVVSVALLLGAPACTAGDKWSASPETIVACGGSTTQQYAVHSGVAPNLTSLDVHRPPSTDGSCVERPLVVWVHGGGWTGGDKMDHIADKIRVFTEAGYAFATVNYRLTDPESDPPAPQYPVHDADVAAALSWLIEHAGSIGVDASRVAVLGHSAGGGIVAAVTTDESFLGAHGLGLDAIRCAGSIDGEGYDVTAGATHPDPAVRDVYLDAFGTDPTVWSTASPVNHIKADTSIPRYLVAVRGPEGRLDLHREFVDKLRAAGVPTTVLDARELDHAEVAVDIGAAGDTVMTPAVLDFLHGCFTD